MQNGNCDPLYCHSSPRVAMAVPLEFCGGRGRGSNVPPLPILTVTLALAQRCPAARPSLATAAQSNAAHAGGIREGWGVRPSLSARGGCR